MNNWAFQIARCIYQSDIFLWKPSWRFKVWIYFIWSVNHIDGKQFKRWQGWFTYDKIYHDCNLSSEWVQKNAIKNVISRMKNQWKLTTQKTTRWFIVTIVKYNDYQTLNNYKNHTEKKLQRTRKEHTNHTITKEWKNEEYIIIEWTSNQEIDESIKKQIKEIIPIEVLTNNREKFFTLVELIALWLSTIATEKAIYSRINDLEKKLDVNGVYTLDMMWQKIYDRKKAWNVAQTCRSWNEAKGIPCGNVLNSFNKFLSNNK